ncbi:MAG TPA: pyridoxamine 5'-phosphate oxidase family protein [Solirubrobacterales bacterium]|nr:pyridoxamine 5'-phosphate oxidase family protein [Solirubrobacterales bacterium]
MPSKRDQIKLTPEEVAEFLAGERVMNIASLGADGWPHLTALWYVMRGTDPWAWTYAKSQKVKNLERDDRATVLFESGDEYSELKGVMLKTRAHIERDTDKVIDFAEELFAKYQGTQPGAEGMRDALRGQAVKRVAIRFEVVETVTWDHSKLGAGVY